MCDVKTPTSQFHFIKVVARNTAFKWYYIAELPPFCNFYYLAKIVQQQQYYFRHSKNNKTTPFIILASLQLS